MIAPRVRCAAAGLWGDKHLCVGAWYVVTDPEGRQFDLCSGACLVEYATLGALPADIDVHQEVGVGHAGCELLLTSGRSTSR